MKSTASITFPIPFRFLHTAYRLWRLRQWRKLVVRRTVSDVFSKPFADYDRLLRAAEASKPPTWQRGWRHSTVLGCSTDMTDAEIALYVYQRAMKTAAERTR